MQSIDPKTNYCFELCRLEGEGQTEKEKKKSEKSGNGGQNLSRQPIVLQGETEDVELCNFLQEAGSKDDRRFKEHGLSDYQHFDRMRISSHRLFLQMTLTGYNSSNSSSSKGSQIFDPPSRISSSKKNIDETNHSYWVCLRLNRVRKIEIQGSGILRAKKLCIFYEKFAGAEDRPGFHPAGTMGKSPQGTPQSSPRSDSSFQGSSSGKNEGLTEVVFRLKSTDLVTKLYEMLQQTIGIECCFDHLFSFAGICFTIG